MKHPKAQTHTLPISTEAKELATEIIIFAQNIAVKIESGKLSVRTFIEKVPLDNNSREFAIIVKDQEDPNHLDEAAKLIVISRYGYLMSKGSNGFYKKIPYDRLVSIGEENLSYILDLMKKLDQSLTY